MNSYKRYKHYIPCTWCDNYVACDENGWLATCEDCGEHIVFWEQPQNKTTVLQVITDAMGSKDVAGMVLKFMFGIDSQWRYPRLEFVFP